MSGAGETDGEISRDETAWRDLIARFDRPADPALIEVPWPAREDLPGSAAARPAAGLAAADAAGPDLAGTPSPASGTDQPGPRPGAQPWPEPGSRCRPPDGTRILPPAGDPRSYVPPDEDDERYVPAPLPPPARLDSVSQAALAGVIGGPGYLLVVSLFLHWTISAVAAFVAVGAFIAGSVTLVVKLGSRPRRDDDDDGAML